MAVAALQNLLSIPPRDLVRTNASGRRSLSELLGQCRAAGLTAVAPADNDVAQLHALFDVALHYGLGTFIYDYVVEVCSDKYCTSSNAVEAYLLDGECVKKWASTALEREENHILQGLSRGFASMSTLGELHRHVGSLSALASILEALLQPAMGQTTSSPAEPLHRAQQLYQCAQVLEWLSQHAASSGPGRFASEQEWRAAIGHRRNAAKPLTPFLQDLLQDLETHHGGSHVQYPPASVEKAVQGIFLEGATDQSAWHAKLALLAYYLLDAGLVNDAGELMQGFNVTPRQLAEWQAYSLLDNALLGDEGSLNEACRILPAAATPAMRFKVVEALAARGRADVALDVLRARRPGTEGAPLLAEAEAALSIRLECNLITEAYMEAREHCEMVDPSVRQRDTSAIIRRLADWAVANRALNDIIKLPFNAREEQALCGWLELQMEAGQPSARFLPLYFLVRGRISEALEAHAQLPAACLASNGEGDNPAAALAQLLAAAATLLPRAQRALCVLPDQATPGPALHIAAATAAAVGPSEDDGPSRASRLPIVWRLGEVEVWAASHPALLAKRGVLSGPLLAESAAPEAAGVNMQGDGQDINMGDASAPTTSQQTTKAQGLNKGGQDIINQGQATAGAWATWRSGDPSAQGGESKSGFGRLGNGEGIAEGGQGAKQAEQGEQDDWQNLLGVPGAGKGTRSSKRARVSASSRIRRLPPR